MTDTGDAFSKTKWNWRNPSVDRASVERSINNASNWTSGHMYRTSYHDMSDKVSSTSKPSLGLICYVYIFKQLHSSFILLYRNLLISSSTLCQSMEVLSQERRVTQNWEDLIQRSQGDVSRKKTDSKPPIRDSKATSKSTINFILVKIKNKRMIKMSLFAK